MQGGRGGKGLASERQKVTKHKGPDLASWGPGMWSMARPHINPCTKETCRCAGGEGRKGPSLRRQKVNHRKGNLRRRTDLSMDRETDAENGSALARMCPYTARPGGEPTEAPRDAVL